MGELGNTELGRCQVFVEEFCATVEPANGLAIKERGMVHKRRKMNSARDGRGRRERTVMCRSGKKSLPMLKIRGANAIGIRRSASMSMNSWADTAGHLPEWDGAVPKDDCNEVESSTHARSTTCCV